MKKEFTKSDLENGMIVQQRDGDVGFIVGDRIYFVGKLEDGEADGWEWLEDYRNDLTHPAEEWLENGDEYDIIKVWSNLGSLATEAVKRVVKNNRPIWERGEDNSGDFCELADNTAPHISKEAFVEYIDALQNFEIALNDIISTICPPEDNIKHPTFADDLESKYLALIANIMGVHGKKHDDLFNWCFADNFGDVNDMCSFDGVCDYAGEVYEKLISK